MGGEPRLVPRDKRLHKCAVVRARHCFPPPRTSPRGGCVLLDLPMPPLSRRLKAGRTTRCIVRIPESRHGIVTSSSPPRNTHTRGPREGQPLFRRPALTVSCLLTCPVRLSPIGSGRRRWSRSRHNADKCE